MIKFILVAIVKMFMSFVNYSVDENTEVILIDEQHYDQLNEMDYVETINYELELDKEGEQRFLFIGAEYENGEEYYGIDFETEDGLTVLVYNSNYELIAIHRETY